jgi:hypothetical protein
MSCWPGGGYGSTCSSAMPSSLSNGAAASVCAITKKCATTQCTESQKLRNSRRKDDNFVVFALCRAVWAALCSHGIRVLQGHIVRPGCQVMIPHTHTHTHTHTGNTAPRSVATMCSSVPFASSCSLSLCCFGNGERVCLVAVADACVQRSKLDSAAHTPPLDTTSRQ